MIRKTLAATKAATFNIDLPNPAHGGMPTPAGSGAFISSDGWFITASHVLHYVDTGRLRDGLEDGSVGAPFRLAHWPNLDFDDVQLDVALLKFDFERNAEKDWLHGSAGFPHLTVSRRPLQEGEPVYAYGFPLSDFKSMIQAGGMSGTSILSPRVTSAIVASDIEFVQSGMSTADPVNYVLDKALNYGNSGGPIIATETGRLHAICTRFQPVFIPQDHLQLQGNPMQIMIPSLYGVVRSLSFPPLLSELEARGIPIADD